MYEPGLLDKLRQRLGGLLQSLHTGMSVEFVRLGRGVAAEFHRHALWQPGCVQQRNGRVAETMKGERVFPVAPRVGPVVPGAGPFGLGPQPGLGEDLAELIGKSAGPDRAGQNRQCSGVQRRMGIIRTWLFFEVFAQGRSDRQDHCPTGFSGDEPKLIVDQIDIAPAKRSQITQSLAGIESAEGQSFPFRIADRQNRLNLLDSESSADRCNSLLPDRFNVLCRILGKKFVSPRTAK
jgi:hypothetical protein